MVGDWVECLWLVTGWGVCFGTFTKMALIKTNDIYIFARWSAILNLCKLYNHPIERCGTINK